MWPFDEPPKFMEGTNSIDLADILWPNDFCWSSDGKLEVCGQDRFQLLNFQYGRSPTDWKFWWREPSDEFAGDFWWMVEMESRIAMRNVPGAWVD